MKKTLQKNRMNFSVNNCFKCCFTVQPFRQITYLFKGLTFETLGPWCKEVIRNRLIAESGDSKSKKFLFERISFAIQSRNAANIQGTFPDSAILSKIFVL
jgi:hypothetical protein